MMSFEWDLKVEKLPMNKQIEAMVCLQTTSIKKHRLENARLKDIARKLKRNEKALELGTKRVKKSLDNLKKVASALKAINGLLGIVAKIV